MFKSTNQTLRPAQTEALGANAVNPDQAAENHDFAKMLAQAELNSQQQPEQAPAQTLENRLPTEFHPLFNYGQQHEAKEIADILKKIELLKSGIDVGVEKLAATSPGTADQIRVQQLHDQAEVGSGKQRFSYYEAQLMWVELQNKLAESWNAFVAKESRFWRGFSESVNKKRKDFDTSAGTAGA
jgi:hypothetical protein